MLNSEVEKKKIKGLILEGNKLEAVKKVRAVLNVSLAEAKSLIESTDFDASWEAAVNDKANYKVAETDETKKEKIMQLLLERRRLEAVKMIKEIYGLTLAEAKKVSDNLEDQLIQSGRLAPRKGSKGIFRLIRIALLIAALYAIYKIFE